MTTFTFECVECGKTDSAEPNSPRAREELCYKHYVKGIRFTFRGVDGGRESFHNRTVEDIHRDAKSYEAETGRKVRVKSQVNGAFA